MKNLKKIASVALALVMTLALCVPAFAAGEGEGTITVTNAAKGEKYKLVQLFTMTFSAENDAYSYMGTVPAELADYFEADAQGYVTVKDAALAPGSTTELSSEAVEAITAWAKNAPAYGDVVTAEGDKVVFSDLPYGYYVVVSRTERGDEDDQITGGAVSVTSTAPDATIYDKNDSNPHFPTDGGKEVDKRVVGVGETVIYTVTYITTNWIGEGEDAEQVIKYTVADTLPDFLTDVEVTEITVDGEDIGVQQFDSYNEIEIDWADPNGDEWTSRYDNGAELKITYTATVTEQILNSPSDNDDHQNVVTITPTTTEGPGTPDEDEEEIYTATIVIDKHDGNDEAKKLPGAKFVLMNKDGKYYTWNEAEGKVEWVATQDDATEENKGMVVTDEDGAANFEGLGLGTYTLIEIEAPEGYNKMEDKEIEVTADEDTVAANISQSVDVPNNTGALLPSTGGIGTTIFYVVGGILVAGAVILLVTRKRVNED